MGYAQKNTTVIKIMDVLRLFVEHKKLSLAEMISRTGMPRTSLLRLLSSLEEMGLLQRDDKGCYALGLLFLKYGQLVAERLDVRAVAQPVMERLKDEAGEAVNLAIRDGNEAVYIEKVDTSHPVKVYTAVGRRAALHGGACPRILLAFMPKAEQESYLETVELKRYATGTIVDKDELRRVLAETRQKGYSHSDSELQDFSAAVAAPVFDGAGRVVASLSIVGLSAKFTGGNLQRLIGLVQRGGREISQQLGWDA